MLVAGNPSSHRFRHRKSACRFVSTNTSVRSATSRPASPRMLRWRVRLVDSATQPT